MQLWLQLTTMPVDNDHNNTSTFVALLNRLYRKLRERQCLRRSPCRGADTRSPEQIKAELVELQRAIQEEANRFGRN
jgi:hypothetical protein